MQLVVNLPETVDPGMLDQLAAAVQRMGGSVQPEAQEPAMAGPPSGMDPGAPPMGPPPMGARANRPPGIA